MKRSLELEKAFDEASHVTLGDPNPSLSDDNKTLTYKVKLPTSNQSGTIVFELMDTFKGWKGIKEEQTVRSYRRGPNGEISDQVTVKASSFLRLRRRLSTPGNPEQALQGLRNNLNVAVIPNASRQPVRR